MIKAIKSLAKNVTGFFKTIINAVLAIPDFFFAIIDLCESLLQSIVSLVGFIFNLVSSLDDAIEFLGTGLETVTAVVGYMPQQLLAVCTMVISILVVRMFLDLL